MLILATILFILSAFFGTFILKAILKNKRTPGPVVFVHGISAIFALLIAIAYTVGHPSILLITSIGLFIAAAFGGFTMLYIDMSKKLIPKIIAIIHPIFAVTGLILLLIYVYNLLAAQ